jgi:hypothetical protein
LIVRSVARDKVFASGDEPEHGGDPHAAIVSR